MARNNRDTAVDRLLRRMSHERGATPASRECLDAGLLAAYADGSLSKPERAAAEAHAADCRLCLQLLAAMARTHEAVASSRTWRLPVIVRWAVPLAAAATAVALWVNVDRERPPAAPAAAPVETESLDRLAQTPAAQNKAADESRQNAASVESRRGDRAQLEKPSDERKQRADARGLPTSLTDRDLAGREAPATPAPPVEAPPPPSAQFRSRAKAPPPPPAQTPAQTQAPPPPPAQAPAQTQAPPPPPAQAPAQTQAQAPPPPSAQAVGQMQARAPLPSSAREQAPPSKPASADMAARRTTLAETVVVISPIQVISPDPSRRWRIKGAVVERSIDGGASWVQQPTRSVADILAGSSPSPNVCWLAGRVGTVLLSTDGEQWQRLGFPEAVDLRAVRAKDAREAEVTTADGRVFRTADGGRTWSLQEAAGGPF